MVDKTLPARLPVQGGWCLFCVLAVFLSKKYYKTPKAETTDRSHLYTQDFFPLKKAVYPERMREGGSEARGGDIVDDSVPIVPHPYVPR